MKIAVIIVRVLLGLLFLFASVSFFLKLTPEQPELTGDFKVFSDGLNASGYIMNVVKAIELMCAIAFIIGRFVPLATIVIFPITVNIVLIHALLVPAGLPVAIFVLLANLFLAYAYRKHYEGLLAAK